VTRLLLPVVVGAAVVVSAPFMGELRRWIRLQFPGHFVPIVGTAVAIAGVAVATWVVTRIRDRKASRFALIAVALIIAAGYARWSALGVPDSDVVELVHFLEYGAVAWLFYRAWLPIGDASVLLLAFLSALTVGTFEEWFEWFIPARVGELRDVLLNSVAIGCGLLASLAIRPLPAGDRHGPSRPRRNPALAFVLAIAMLALGGFIDMVHLGHDIREPNAGTFRSIFTAAGLDEAASERTTIWAAHPPMTRPSPLSREDQYASEGLLHVQARNQAWGAGLVVVAWHENLILERYFAPVLDTPSYVSKSGHRWSPDQRADAERRLRDAPAAAGDFVSHAQGAFPIVVWSKPVFRGLVLTAASGLIVLAVALRRRGV
jgi:hypothetical protein